MSVSRTSAPWFLDMGKHKIARRSCSASCAEEAIHLAYAAAGSGIWCFAASWTMTGPPFTELKAFDSKSAGKEQGTRSSRSQTIHEPRCLAIDAGVFEMVCSKNIRPWPWESCINCTSCCSACDMSAEPEIMQVSANLCRCFCGNGWQAREIQTPRRKGRPPAPQKKSPKSFVLINTIICSIIINIISFLLLSMYSVVAC